MLFVENGRFGKYLLVTCFILMSFWVYSSTLNVKATYSSETSVNYQKTVLCYAPEDRTLQSRYLVGHFAKFDP
jgi:hypothetical protein